MHHRAQYDVSVTKNENDNAGPLRVYAKLRFFIEIDLRIY